MSVDRWCGRLAVVAALLGAGCSSTPSEKVPVEVNRTAPASCADIKAQQPGAIDGRFVVYAGHDWTKPWIVDCADMAGATAHDYLAVVTTSITGAAVNLSRYQSDAVNVVGTPVVTRFTKLRIDPASFVVSTGDLRFSSSTGHATKSGGSGGPITSMAFAAAADGACDATYAAVHGAGSVDLTGTPFAVVPGAFALQGSSSVGGAVYGSENQVVTLTAGGCPGFIAPTGAADPSNGGSGALPLVYVGW